MCLLVLSLVTVEVNVLAQKLLLPKKDMRWCIYSTVRRPSLQTALNDEENVV